MIVCNEGVDTCVRRRASSWGISEEFGSSAKCSCFREDNETRELGLGGLWYTEVRFVI